MPARPNLDRKGLSPFFPGQPVPIDLFVGRRNEIQRITRAAEIVSHGRPQAVFIAGEYGIGKSSLAQMIRSLAEYNEKLLGMHVILSNAESLDDVAFNVVQKVIETSASKVEGLRNLLGKYIGQTSLLGLELKFDELRRDTHEISQNFVPYLRSIYEQIRGRYHGICLIMDEINGLATKPFFGPFLKGLVDGNALSASPVPLLLILCGIDERRRQIIEQHKPVERIFEVAVLEPMTVAESRQFFATAFGKSGMRVEPNAMDPLCRYSGGLPRLMHLIGDAAFWRADADYIDREIVEAAIVDAADEVGRKFVDQQVVRALKSKNYRQILMKLAQCEFELEFRKTEIEQHLTLAQRKNFGNFLQKMKTLRVIESGEIRGEYRFTDWLTRIYLNMLAERQNPTLVALRET